MKFEYPNFLYAFVAVAIPILIHLFNLRKYKTVYFTNVSFLKNIQQQTQSKSKLKNLLVLLARILTIVFLVLAFAVPFIPAKKLKTSHLQKAVSIYLDNSFSMDAIGKNGRLIEDAKNNALAIVALFQDKTRFRLVTNDFEGSDARWVNKEEFIQLLEGVKVSPNHKSFDQIMARQVDGLQAMKDYDKSAFILSDFQQSFFKNHSAPVDTSLQVFLVPIIAEEHSNVYIDSCWFETPLHKYNQLERLYCRIVNKSTKNLENIPIKITVGNQLKTTGSVSIQANSKLDTSFCYTSKLNGIHNGCIELSDFPITFDNAFYFSYSVDSKLHVLCINGARDQNKGNGNKFLNALFARDSLISLNWENENRLNYSGFSSYSILFLNELKSISSGLSEELQKFTLNGGSIVVLPSEQLDAVSYSDFLAAMHCDTYLKIDSSDSKIGKVNFNSDLFNGIFEKKTDNIDLPHVTRHFELTHRTQTVSENLLALQNGSAFLECYSIGKGKVYLFAAPLNESWSNLGQHALFVPTIYQMVLLSRIKPQLYYTIGNNASIETSTVQVQNDLFHIVGTTVNTDFIPEMRVFEGKSHLFIHNQVKTAGNYLLLLGKDTLSGVAFNYDRLESDPACYSIDALKTVCEDEHLKGFSVIDCSKQTVKNAIGEITQGKQLWKLCIIFALIFLALEIALLRLLKS